MIIRICKKIGNVNYFIRMKTALYPHKPFAPESR